MTHCANHCTSCGRHFTSIAAFDRHRAGDHEDHRYCESPALIADRHGRLAFESVHGVCALGRTPARDVPVWSLAGGRERARERFGRAETA